MQLLGPMEAKFLESALSADLDHAEHKGRKAPKVCTNVSCALLFRIWLLMKADEEVENHIMGPKLLDFY